MKKTIFALTAVVMTAGAALAQGDSAPASTVVNQPANVDYSSNSAINAPVGATNQQERALIIQKRADNR